MNDAKQIYGLMAAFKDHEALLEAAHRTRADGYRRIDAYTPFPVEGLADALGYEEKTVPLLFLVGGIIGGLGGYFMQWYAMSVDYPLRIGGKPLNSWPMFVPITFELTVLISALCGFFGTLALCGFPQPYHPVFNVAEFRRRASRDGFFLCVEAADPKFDLGRTRKFLEQFRPYIIEEVAE
jgi:hypothetical protein